MHGLSVILPVYNGEDFLERAILSIIKQQPHRFNIEIIVVNDGSTDNSLAMLEKMRATYDVIQVINIVDNRGVAAARNAGIQAARGTYLSFIDQDDCWVENKLQIMQQAIQDFPNYHYFISYQKFFLSPGIAKPTWCKEIWLKEPQVGYVFGTLFIKKEDFVRVGLLDTSLISGVDDVKWFIQAGQQGLLCKMLNEVLLYRYIHEHNQSRKTRKANMDLLSLIRKKISYEK